MDCFGKSGSYFVSRFDLLNSLVVLMDLHEKAGVHGAGNLGVCSYLNIKGKG